MASAGPSRLSSLGDGGQQSGGVGPPGQPSMRPGRGGSPLSPGGLALLPAFEQVAEAFRLAFGPPGPSAADAPVTAPGPPLLGGSG
ncbi:MAG: hypothetical protein ACK55I_02715, partial [bacterium]